MEQLKSILTDLENNEITKHQAYDLISILLQSNEDIEAGAFINIYEDQDGKYISDDEYPTYNEARRNRDAVAIYVETVRIIKGASPSKLREAAERGYKKGFERALRDVKAFGFEQVWNATMNSKKH